MLTDLWIGLALVLVIEGILPFLCPECWRTAMQKLTAQQPKTLRIIGLLSMLAGIIFLYIVH